MNYEAKNFERLLGTPGFSDEALKIHFGLYEGYVKNTNLAQERLKALEPGTPEYSELKRRFGWEWNGMRLHEYYFGGMTKDGQGIDQSSKLHGKIAEEFGSYENWEKDFRGTGAMRGIGWAVLAHDKEADRLFNVWVNEHDMGHLAGATPVLIMDVFEHAFMVDYGTKRAEYIDAFMKAIDWEVSESRFS